MKSHVNSAVSGSNGSATVTTGGKISNSNENTDKSNISGCTVEKSIRIFGIKSFNGADEKEAVKADQSKLDQIQKQWEEKDKIRKQNKVEINKLFDDKLEDMNKKQVALEKARLSDDKNAALDALKGN